MRFLERALALFALCTVVLLSYPTFIVLALESPTIQLYQEATVTSDQVLLGDLAEITGDGEVVENLAEVYIGTAPLVGSTRRITRGQIEVRLRAAKFDPRKITFTGADEVKVQRVLPEIYPEEAHGIHAKENSPVTQAPQIEVEESSHTFLAVVAARQIDRWEVLTLEDLRVEERDRRGYIRESGPLADFIGKRTVRIIPAGTVLTQNDVETPPIVERGDVVQLIARVGGIEVNVPGRARESGILNQVIAVENLVSNRVVYGKVVSSTVVEVSVEGAN